MPDSNTVSERSAAAPAGEGVGPPQAGGPAAPDAQERDQIAHLQRLLAEREASLQDITRSTAWQVTAPLRRLLTGRPVLRRLLRGLALRFRDRPAPLEVEAAPQAPSADAPLVNPPAADFAAAVPFRYLAAGACAEAPAMPGGTPAIAVICHIYFTELAQELRAYLAHIPYDYDLYLSTDSAAKQGLLQDCFVAGPGRGEPRRVEIKVVANRGRDVAPKLLSWPQAHASHEYVLHLHAKMSGHAGSRLSGWRTYLLETLLGSEAVVRSVFAAFAADPGLGMVAPDHLISLRRWLGWSRNLEQAQRFARRLGVAIEGDGLLDFPSGSMFWARSAALRPLLESGLSLDQFEPEAGQIDATLAHAIERLFFFCCERAGLAWMKIAPAALPGQHAAQVVVIDNAAALAQFCTRRRVWLTEAVQAGGAPAPGACVRVSRLSPGGSAVDADPLLHAAWELSGHRAMGYAAFAAEVGRLCAGAANRLDFDEEFYLAANPDVAHAVVQGRFSCGYVHFCLEGRESGRPWSDRQLEGRFALRANFPLGMMRAEHLLPPPLDMPVFAHRPLAPAPLLLVLVQHLQEDLFFAGYSSLFRDLAPVFDGYARIVVAVANAQFDARLAQRYCERIEVMTMAVLTEMPVRPHVVVCMNHELVLRAMARFGDNRRIVYYCQEFEAGFVPYGSRYVEAETAISCVRWLVLSTLPLEDFLRRRGLVTDQRVCRTAPRIEVLDVDPAPRQRIFFYFRPEFFNSRNLPETVSAAVRAFCLRHDGYEIYLMGSVATRYSYTLNGNSVFVISKLPAEEYHALLASCDAAVALIYAAHPGVIAFQAAASGIPTVTNTFDNRDSAWLKSVSDNFVAFDPVREHLVDKVEQALARPKGVKSFNQALYDGPASQTLAGFLEDVRLGRLERADSQAPGSRSR